MLGLPRWLDPLLSARIILIAAVAVAAPALAAEGESDGTSLALQAHGFISQGFIKTTGNDYLVANSRRGSFEFSEAGINFTSQLTDKLRVGLQLFAYDLGTLGTYAVSADWYYLDYRLRDWFGLRAGRLKLPLGLYNDIADVDAARVPILLPSGLYSVTNRDLLLAQTGGEVYGFIRLRRFGALDYRIFGGSIAINLPSQLAPNTSIGVPYVAGGRLFWETPIEGLRVGATGLVLKAEASAVLPAPSPLLTETEVVYSGVGSIEYAAHDLLLQAEFVQQRSVVTNSSDTTLVPLQAIVSEGGYGLAAYRLTRWFQPGLYYSFFFRDRNKGDETGPGTTNGENIQDDLAATLRFDVNNFWIIKLEGHYMHGTALLTGSPTVASFPEDWGLFVVKTTAYF